MNKIGLIVLLLAADLLVSWYTSSGWLEYVATTTGLLSVFLTARENIWAWPTGLVNVACFFVMFLDARLYADMTLQVFFFALSVLGWIVWLTDRGGRKVRPTRQLDRRLALILAGALVVVTLVWGYSLAKFTDASIPFADALIATLSLIAQFLLSYKFLQNWYVWIVVDVLSIGMYAYKELYSVAFLYVVFLGLATAGLLSWKRDAATISRGAEVRA
ncbi:nicotinamide mononucleotide transporter [Paenibacillus athensensis]|uniref:Nicotinamide mononucleotide transporter n=1 Tax=Paenibacillus athensensis TaxID=1967502 RepID=A0A4Y8PQ54_9BACL|nr:nicotinamide riboside transporter PnuC [Paenibacillus athensensis]MCD1261503.1 nicotinamide mononucleotide transporter [Paenibacillus athensensis]